MLQITHRGKLYNQVRFDEFGQTRIVVLVVTILILFGLGLGYNATLESSQNFTQSVHQEEIGIAKSTPKEDLQNNDISNGSLDTNQPQDDNNTVLNSPAQQDNYSDGDTFNITECTDDRGLCPENKNETTQESEASKDISKGGSDAQTIHPQINVVVHGPEKVTRGRAVIFHATIRNTGSMAKNVAVRWNPPTGFEIIKENSTCDVLKNGGICTSTLEVVPTLTTNLGEATLNVEVSYE